MTLPRPTLRLLPLAAAALAIAAAAAAPGQTVDLNSLVAESPFAPVGNAAPTAATSDTLELRGVVISDGKSSFNIFDSSSRSAVWVSIDEPGYPFVVRAYDSAQSTATVEYNRKTIALPLKQSKLQLAASIVNMTQPVAAPGTPQPNAVTAVAGSANATPQGPDQARLQAIADEIRRRRALRAAAAANAANNEGANQNPADQRRENPDRSYNNQPNR